MGGDAAETFVVPGATPRTELITVPLAQMRVDAYEASAATCFGLRLAGRLKEISAPTLVLLWGDHDAKTPWPLSEAIASGILGATLAVLPGAGHLSNLDNPAGLI